MSEVREPEVGRSVIDEGLDQQQVEAARAGDDEAFAALVRRHAPVAWQLARLLLHDDHEAEDATQEAFVRAHGSLHTFRGDGSFRSWLLTICRRVCVDRLRLVRPELVPLDGVVLSADGDGQPELALAIRAAVSRLDDEERAAFVLVDVLGHNRREAAEVLEVPASTVRSRVARARERLADQLADHDDPRGDR